MKTFKQFVFEHDYTGRSPKPGFGHDEHGNNLWSMVKHKNSKLLEKLKWLIEGVVDEYEPWYKNYGNIKGEHVGFAVFPDEEGYEYTTELVDFLRTYFHEGWHFELYSAITPNYPHWINLRTNLSEPHPTLPPKSPARRRTRQPEL